MRAAGSLHSRASWVLLWGLRQPEKLMVGPCWETAPGSIPEWGAVLELLLPPISEVSLSRDAQYRACCKSCYRGKELWCCSKSKKGKSDSAENKYLFDVCVFISQSCWTVLRCTQYILSWNAILFSFTPQCKPCLKNKTPSCLEVRLKYLFCCLQLLSAFKNWRLNTDTGELKSGWVTKQGWLQGLCIQLWKCHTVPS